MAMKNLRRVSRLGLKVAETDWKKHMKRAALVGGLGVAVAGVGLGLGVGVAGWTLWRRFGMRAAEVRGKVVLITGGSRGLGFAMAQEFARLGARVVICARDQRGLELASEQLQRFGTDVLAIPCDVADRDDVLKMVNEAKARFGNIDVLINNAGVIQVGPLESQTIVDFQEAMDVMFWGMVYPTLALLPDMMRRRSGRIANITSIGGKIAVPHLLPYDSAKFAAVGFSEGLRAEMAKYGVKITTVCPGLMRTGSYLNAHFKGDNRAEFNWFAVSATTPGVAMNAERAARRIVAAIRRGRAEIILSPQAKLAAMFHGLFPGLTADMLGAVNRVLPSVPMGTGQDRHTGKQSQTRLTESAVTFFGKRAAENLNQWAERSDRPAPLTRPDLSQTG